MRKLTKFKVFRDTKKIQEIFNYGQLTRANDPCNNDYKLIIVYGLYFNFKKYKRVPKKIGWTNFNMKEVSVKANLDSNKEEYFLKLKNFAIKYFEKLFDQKYIIIGKVKV